jgi:16S rRNA (cytosine967-C5)-methyltransferase
LTNPRQIALDLLLRVETTDSYINLLLPKVLGRLEISDADRGLVQELSYGALRWKAQYDAFIDQLTPGKVLTLNLRLCLQLGMHQLFRMRVPSHAAIHETVELVKTFEKSASGLANAVLRNADRAGFAQLLERSSRGLSKTDALALKHSHPAWVVSALKTALELDGRGADLESLLEANNLTPLVNLAALTPKAEEVLSAAGLDRGGASPIGFIAQGNPEPLLSNPGVRVQDQGSQLVALALLAKGKLSGKWLDMCSGPGGKSAVIQAGIREAGGSLDCFEPNPQRAELVRSALSPDGPGKVIVAFGQDAPANSYDAILLDAPCSGLGSVRRKPESRWRKKPEQLPELIKLQAELLDAAAKALKPGGYLLYSTCSPLIPETNAQIKSVLERHPDLKLEDANEGLQNLSPALNLNRGRKTAQLWTHLHGTDAMFLSLLSKQ